MICDNFIFASSSFFYFKFADRGDTCPCAEVCLVSGTFFLFNNQTVMKKYSTPDEEKEEENEEDDEEKEK